MQQHEEDIGKYVLQLDCLLGSGSMADVYKGYIKKGRVAVAIKKISLSNVMSKTKEKSVQVVRQSIQLEAEMLRKLDHPNIIRFIDLCEKRSTRHVYIVTEFANRGTFKQMIE